jgi:hypothetical protein
MAPAEHETENMMMQTPGGWTSATAVSPAGAVAAVPHVPTFNGMPQVMTAYPYDFSFPVYMQQMTPEYDAYVPGKKELKHKLQRTLKWRKRKKKRRKGGNN